MPISYVNKDKTGTDGIVNKWRDVDANEVKTVVNTHLSDTSNPHSVTKTQVGLGNVDNTSDTNKPVSTATQTALDLKAATSGPTFTGLVTVSTIKITGGTPGAGKILTSDADGDASWQDPISDIAPLLNWVFPESFGAVGDGITDDSAAFTLAIASFPSNGGVLYLGNKTYLINTQVVINKPITIQGQGAFNANNMMERSSNSYANAPTKIITTSTTLDVFVFTTNNIRVYDVSFENRATTAPTAGSAIKITSGISTEDGIVNYPAGFQLVGCSFSHFYLEVDVVNSYYWVINRCAFSAPVLTCIKIQNLALLDGGDAMISDCFFNGHDYTSKAAIWQLSGSGLKIVNCKCNTGKDNSHRFEHFYLGEIEGSENGGGLSILLMANNSIENTKLVPIKLTGNGEFYAVSIVGGNIASYYNDHGTANTGHHIEIEGVKGVSIDNVNFRKVVNTLPAIKTTGCENVSIGSGNTYLGYTDQADALDINAHATNKIWWSPSTGGGDSIWTDGGSYIYYTGGKVIAYGSNPAFQSKNTSDNIANFEKTDVTYTPYKIFGVQDLTIYSGGTGDISILNDNSTGVIKFAAGGSSTAHLTIGITGNLLQKASTYHNFGTTEGSSGYGVRDNAGTIEFKNSGGSWTALGSGGGSSQWTTDGSNIYYDLGLVEVRTASSGAVAGYQLKNSSGHIGQFGKTGSGYTPYKTLGANDYYLYNGGSGNMKFLNDNGIGTIAFAAGGSSTDHLTISTAGAITFNTYGAGTLVTDASGNITASSDERLKDIKGAFKTGLAALLNINPIIYNWNEKSGFEIKNTYAGFSAQNIKEHIPFGTGENSDRTLTLQDRALMATMVNAIKEQQSQIEILKQQLSLLKQ